MQHTNLGRTGLVVSRICLGTMTFGLQCDEPTSRAILDAAADGGVTFLDTADVYPLGGDLQTVGRTEEIVGRWLAGRRDQFIVATKCVGRMVHAAEIVTVFVEQGKGSVEIPADFWAGVEALEGRTIPVTERTPV